MKTVISKVHTTKAGDERSLSEVPFIFALSKHSIQRSEPRLPGSKLQSIFCNMIIARLQEQGFSPLSKTTTAKQAENENFRHDTFLI